MNDRRRAWLWFAAAFSFGIGLILVFNDSSAGWFLIIMGIIYLGVSTRTGQTWAASNPRLARWGLAGVILLLLILIGVAGAVFLLR